MENSDEELLTLKQAAIEVGYSATGMRYLIRQGELKVERKGRPASGVGRPTHMIRRGELERWRKERRLDVRVVFPQNLHSVVVPISVAARLSGRSKQRLGTALREGRLKGISFGGHAAHIRLKDLENYLNSDWVRKMERSPRQLDLSILSKLDALQKGGDKRAS